MKELFLLAIRFYQATRLMRLPACRFYPSCSDYAKQSIEMHGVLKGATLAVFRLLRCQPFCKGGTDFPPTRTVGVGAHCMRQFNVTAHKLLTETVGNP